MERLGFISSPLSEYFSGFSGDEMKKCAARSFRRLAKVCNFISMKRLVLLLLCAPLLWACNTSHDNAASKRMTPVDFSKVTISDSFWSPRLDKHKDVTLQVCIDQIENQTGRIRNFENAAAGTGQHSGIFFDDSDVYKALEGMAYSLQNHPDPVLEAKCDEWIDKIATAQQPDGYINTYYTLTGLENRWRDMDKHEMYCAGHMIEAAVAYYKVTGKRKLLDVSIRMADHMMSIFGPDKRHWVPGHEEIELALVKLYLTTGEPKYLDFAGWLLGERGHGYGSYGDDRQWPGQYYQDLVPVEDLENITGHAVRAMYLFCGMADVAALTGNEAYMAALDRMWDDVVLRNMYITGGIGQTASNEGFTEDYSLPNLTAYCETCASVGMVLWNWRMNQFSGDGKHTDIVEKALYNGSLAGISLDGDRFFYVNPLESRGNHHRQAWYGCACCPSQICRFLPSIGNYIYATSDDAIWVHQYIGNHAEFDYRGWPVAMDLSGNYPWDGNISLKIGLERPVKTQLRLRIPAWCESWTVAVNGETVAPTVENGYAVINRKWQDGDVVALNLDMPAVMVAADSRVKEDEGCRAIQRGPIVYCMEEVDNPDDFADLTLAENVTLTATSRPDLLDGIIVIDARSSSAGTSGTGSPLPTSATTTNLSGTTLHFIPYYAWDNRAPGRMKVWIPLR